jgi:Tn3 transposase DDE domain
VWRPVRVEFAARVRQPLQATRRLDQLAGEQAELVKRLDAALDAEASAQLSDGELVIEAGADKDEPGGKLGKLVAERLPEIGLPELLIEVDGWTGFTTHLTPAGSAASRGAELPCVLYAAILAQATNLGLTGMARGSRFTYDQLDWATDWYLREATLYPANACLVDYHHALPLAGAVGSGRLSSSDGVRLASRTRGPETGALPRYFGHRRRGIQRGPRTSTASTTAE